MECVKIFIANRYISKSYTTTIIDRQCTERVACEQAFSRAGWGEGKAKIPFPFLAIFPQTESLFTGYRAGGAVVSTLTSWY